MNNQATVSLSAHTTHLEFWRGDSITLIRKQDAPALVRGGVRTLRPLNVNNDEVPVTLTRRGRLTLQRNDQA